MFEKEAEEYAVLNARQYIHNEDIGFCTSEEEVRQAYQKGAEFGYNKANEWHDLRKNPNNLPKECENVLCFCYGASVEYYGVGHFIKSHSDLIWWSNNGSSKLLNVIAWCELPRFEGQ